MPAKSAGLNQRGQISRGKPRQVTGDVAVNWVWVLGRLSVGKTAPCPGTPRSADGLVGPGSSPGENGVCGAGCVGRERVGRERVGRLKPFTRRTGARPAINPLPGVRRIRFLRSRVEPQSGGCAALDLKNRIRPAGCHGIKGRDCARREMVCVVSNKRGHIPSSSGGVCAGRARYGRKWCVSPFSAPLHRTYPLCAQPSFSPGRRWPEAG